jgi:NAD(P)H dehydrogenase (quinone)
MGDHPAATIPQLGSWTDLKTQSIGDRPLATSPHPGDRLTAERFGRRIARATSRWMMGADAFRPQPISEAESCQRNVEGPEEWRRFDD